MESVSIAVEDPLSERVLRRLINHTRRDWTVGVRYPLKAMAGGVLNPKNIAEKRGLSGYGQIRARLPAFNNLAKVKPFIILTDLDIHVACPGDLWSKWQPRMAKNPNLLFQSPHSSLESKSLCRVWINSAQGKASVSFFAPVNRRSSVMFWHSCLRSSDPPACHYGPGTRRASCERGFECECEDAIRPVH